MKQLIVLAAAILAGGSLAHGATISFSMQGQTEGWKEVWYPGQTEVVPESLSCQASDGGNSFGSYAASCVPSEEPRVSSEMSANFGPTKGDVALWNRAFTGSRWDENLGADVHVDSRATSEYDLVISGRYIYRGLAPHRQKWLVHLYSSSAPPTMEFTINGTPSNPYDDSGVLLFMPGETYDINLRLSGFVGFEDSHQFAYDLGPLSAATPEPSTYAMLGAGLAGFLALRRSRNS